MLRLGPYIRSFWLAWSTQLSYRLNFIVGRLREFVVYGAMLLLYSALPQGSGSYSQSDLLTYTLISSLFGSAIFIYIMTSIANEIAEGNLTNYLLRPINYFGFWISQSLAARVLTFGGGLLQLALLTWLFSDKPLALQNNIFILLQTAILFLGALTLVQALDFVGGLFSFWTNRGHGMRWLIMILIQFLSGSYIPLDTLPGPVHQILRWTPFPSLLFAPLQSYLGRLTTSVWLQTVMVQWVWIGIIVLLVRLFWTRGLKTYGAYGR